MTTTWKKDSVLLPKRCLPLLWFLVGIGSGYSLADAIFRLVYNQYTGTCWWTRSWHITKGGCMHILCDSRSPHFYQSMLSLDHRQQFSRLSSALLFFLRKPCRLQGDPGSLRECVHTIFLTQAFCGAFCSTIQEAIGSQVSQLYQTRTSFQFILIAFLVCIYLQRKAIPTRALSWSLMD